MAMIIIVVRQATIFIDCKQKLQLLQDKNTLLEHEDNGILIDHGFCNLQCGL